MTDELIKDLLQEINKALSEVIKLQEFLAGELIKKR